MMRNRQNRRFIDQRLADHAATPLYEAACPARGRGKSRHGPKPGKTQPVVTKTDSTPLCVKNF